MGGGASTCPTRRVLAEIDWRAAGRGAAERQFQPITRMPALRWIWRWWWTTAWRRRAEAAIRRAGGEHCGRGAVRRLPRRPGGAGKKSLAYSLTLQAPDRTLTSEQATRQRDRIVAALEREFGAQIRG